jgi:hypothetical protein
MEINVKSYVGNVNFITRVILFFQDISLLMVILLVKYLHCTLSVHYLAILNSFLKTEVKCFSETLARQTTCTRCKY